MTSIESRVRTYWIAKYPYLYYGQYLSISIVFIIWVLGNVLGIYSLTKGVTAGQFFWSTAWFIGGVTIFTFSFWYKFGIQVIKIEKEGIQVIKKIGVIQISKRILKNEIRSVSIKEFEPFNPFTGSALKVNKKLGWLLINNDQNYHLNSYLFPMDDLQEFKKQLIAVFELKHS